MPQDNKILIYKGPTKESPLQLEIQDKNGEILGGTYINSIQDLIILIAKLDVNNEIPWKKE